MATWEFAPPKELERLLVKLENSTPEMVDEMLIAGGKVLQPEIKARLARQIGKGLKYRSRSTGQLVDSVYLQKPRQLKNGAHRIAVAFKGNHKLPKGRNAVRNGLKAAIIEYGKSGQAPHPFIRQSILAKESEITNAMQEVFERYIENQK